MEFGNRDYETHRYFHKTVHSDHQPRRKLLAATCSVLSMMGAGQLNGSQAMELGDGQIKGGVLKPYDLNWNQCILQEGEWLNQGELNEKFDRIGDSVVRHRQTTSRPDGGSSVATTFYERNTFSPLRVEVSIFQPDGMRAGWSEYEFNKEGYHGQKTRGEEYKQVSGALTSDMLNGAALGLPIATIDWQDEPLTFLASMLSFDASYEVIATWTGTEQIPGPAGKPVEAWLVDLEWKHRELGDVYAPGPDASGGRFWIVPNPPEGYPYVPRYKTDTYVIEFTREYCPETGQK